MKKGDVFEGTVLRMDFPNKGILEIEQQRIEVKNALPGQKIRGGVTKKRNGKCEGKLMEVLEHSKEERPEEACVHSGLCGGCLYQGLPYEEQLKIKREQVKRLLDQVTDPVTYEFQGIEGSPISAGYRNKMEFSFGDETKGGPLALGMHKRGSFYDIVTTPECQIVHRDFCRILEATREFFENAGVPFYRKLQHMGYLRHLLVRRAVKTGEILVVLVTTSQKECFGGEAGERQALETWKERVLQLSLEGKMAGILHTCNDSLADVVRSDRTEILYGGDWFYEELLGLRFKITPFSFFQTNSLGAEVLYEKVRSYIGDTKDKVVFDLYSGTGTIAQILAPVAKQVVGVEIVEEAVEAARENAKLNGLDNCQFLAGDVLKVVDELKEKPDLIVLDPPRDGIHPKALGKIIDFGVERMVYVSCKPTSLVRDLIVLQERGYRVEKVCCVDMFPETGNCETVVLLTQKRKSKDYKVEIEIPIGVDGSKTYTEEKSTYQNIKKFIKAKYGVNTHTKDIAEVKRDCGVEMRLNYNISKKENPKIRHCTQEKRGYIMDALEYYQVI